MALAYDGSVHNVEFIQLYPKIVRPAVLLAGLALYVYLTWWMLGNGYLRVAQGAYLQLTAIWVLGFVALVLWPGGFTSAILNRPCCAGRFGATSA